MRPCGSGAGVRIDGLFAKEIEECDGVPTRTARGIARKVGLPNSYYTRINNGPGGVRNRA